MRIKRDSLNKTERDSKIMAEFDACYKHLSQKLHKAKQWRDNYVTLFSDTS